MRTYHLSEFCSHTDFPLQILFRSGRNPYQQPALEKAHLHDFIEIVYVINGSGWWAMNGQRVPSFPGDLYIMPLQTVHEFQMLNSMQYYNLLIQAKAFTKTEHAMLKMNAAYDKIFAARGGTPTCCRVPFPQTAKLRSLLAAAMEYSFSGDILFKLEFKSCILLVLCEILRLISSSGALLNGRNHSGEPAMQNISRIADYMTRHYREPLTVSALAARLKMSETGFIRFFRRETGMPPLQYLNHLRIFEACQLLCQPVHSISEIAYCCGFNNSSYFSEMFRRVLNMTPGEYRRQNSMDTGTQEFAPEQ